MNNPDTKWTRGDKATFDRAYDAWCNRRGLPRYSMGKAISAQCTEDQARRKAGAK